MLAHFRLWSVQLGLMLLAAGGALQAQDDGPVKMTPDLALAIPLLLKGKDVTVKFPILINRTTVIRPGMILRVLYLPPVQDDSTDLVLAHKGSMEESYSRSGMTSDERSRMPADVAHEIERQRRIVWEVPINFQLALAQLTTDNLHLIYSQTGDNRHLDDQRLSFFDGLFLGSPRGGVTVLAVETGSKADQAGIKPDDQILSINGRPISDLGSFSDLWSTARATAKEDNAASFPIEVRSTSGSSHTVQLGMPPSLKSQLMQGF